MCHQAKPHRTQPFHTGQCCKTDRSIVHPAVATPCPPQPLPTATQVAQPCLLLPKPVFPGMGSSLLLSPAPGTRSSPQAHPVSAVHATGLHPPLDHLFNCIPGMEIRDAIKSWVLFIFNFFPFKQSQAPFQSPHTAWPGQHLNPSPSYLNSPPQQALNGFLCSYINPYGKYSHALLNKLRVLFSHHSVRFSRKDVIFSFNSNGPK